MRAQPDNRIPDTKLKLIDAGVTLMRRRGFNATTVDDICADAGVTKGGFFHYFKTKEDVAKAALTHFYESKETESVGAPFRKLADPLERVFGRLEFAKQSYGGGGLLTKGCLIGVMAQELSFTNPTLRSACHGSFLGVAKDFEGDLAVAKELYAPRAGFDPKAVSMLYVSIIQGSLMLAKASESNGVLLENIEQFRIYLQMLFTPSKKRGTKATAKTPVS